jgi:hypothetical protein
MAVVHGFWSWSTLIVAGTAFLLGCRHGFDWDHIAAITDLTAASRTEPAQPADNVRRRVALKHHGPRLGLAFWYCVGHGLVIALLGLMVGVLGLNLPPVIDRIFESVVGATLLALGAFVLWQLGRDRGDYRYSGRIRLAVVTVRRAWARARRRGSGPADAMGDLTPRSAFFVGILHGSGAETPTQVVLFASAATSGAKGLVAVLLLSFVTGMIMADLGIALSWLTGLVGAARAPRAQIALGAVTGVSSVTVGTLFLAGRSTLLPVLFGG